MTSSWSKWNVPELGTGYHRRFGRRICERQSSLQRCRQPLVPRVAFERIEPCIVREEGKRWILAGARFLQPLQRRVLLFHAGERQRHTVGQVVAADVPIPGWVVAPHRLERLFVVAGERVRVTQCAKGPQVV